MGAGRGKGWMALRDGSMCPSALPGRLGTFGACNRIYRLGIQATEQGLS